MKKVRSSQPCISMNFCTEFSKAQVFPCEYRESIVKAIENSMGPAIILVEIMRRFWDGLPLKRMIKSTSNSLE